MSDIWLRQYGKIRQAEIAREMETIRLVRLAKKNHRPIAPLWRTLLFKTGRAFIACGLFLQKCAKSPVAEAGRGR